MAAICNSVWNYVSSTITSFMGPPPQDPIKVLPPFGREEWQIYLGVDVEDDLPVPESLRTILEGACPITEGKLVKETHILCLVPKGMSLEELMRAAGGNWRAARHTGNATQTVEETHWILMTKKILPDTHAKTPEQHRQMAQQLQYEIPTTVEAAVAILAAKYLGEAPIFSQTGYMTRCHEVCDGWPMTIGKSGDATPFRISAYDGGEKNGVAGVKRFF